MCVGSSGLVVCCKLRGAEELTCGTRHNGAKFESPEGIDLRHLLFVHDPKNRSRFLTGPWAERSWFSESALRVMAVDSKTVPEWAEVFRIGRMQAYGDMMPATTQTIQEELDFVDVAQDLKTPRKEWGIPKKEEEEISSPAFLSERDLELRDKWQEDSFMPTGIVDHIEKLGDAMNDVFAQKDLQDRSDLEWQTCVAEDLSKIQAWQLKTDARIGQPVKFFGREFAGLWEALGYSVHQATDTTADEIRRLKATINEKEAKELELKKEQVSAWKLDVSNSFMNVKAHCDAVVEELRQVKEELVNTPKASPGGGALPAGAGRSHHEVLFPPRRSPEDQPTPEYEEVLKEINAF